MIIGVDVSKYNLGWSPDKATKPISFVVQRASWSLYKDEGFDALLPQVLKIPIRGAYHYYSSGVPWKAQADLFLSVTKGKGFHFYVVDYERAYNTLNARTIAEVSEMVKYIKSQTGQRCMVYFSPSIYNESIKPFGYGLWAHQQDIWIAQYPWTLTQTPPTSTPAIPDNLPWRIWQYGGGDVNYTAGRHAGADYGGGLVGIDLNYFNGTEAELLAWAGVTDVPVVIPTPADPPTPQPAPLSGLYQFDPVNYWQRPGGGPLTLPMSRVRKLGNNLYPLDWRYLEPIIARLNPTNKAAPGKIAAPNWGPSKGLDGNIIKWIGLLWPGRNVVRISEIVEGWGKVEGVTLSSVGTVNPYDNPDTVHLIYDWNKKSGYGEMNKPVYIPIIRDPGPWWVDMTKLVSIDGQLPKTVKITASPGLNIRANPTTASAIVGAARTGSLLTVTQVVTGKGGLWGKVSSGWIALRNMGANLTDWKV